MAKNSFNIKPIIKELEAKFTEHVLDEYNQSGDNGPAIIDYRNLIQESLKKYAHYVHHITFLEDDIQFHSWRNHLLITPDFYIFKPYERLNDIPDIYRKAFCKTIETLVNTQLEQKKLDKTYNFFKKVEIIPGSEIDARKKEELVRQTCIYRPNKSNIFIEIKGDIEPTPENFEKYLVMVDLYAGVENMLTCGFKEYEDQVALEVRDIVSKVSAQEQFNKKLNFSLKEHKLS